MRFKILEFLKENNNYISGEEISKKLNLSRQAVFKYISELKEIGYEILAIPHLGYKLISSPDRLFPFELQDRLNTKFMGRKIYYYDLIDSTMDMAMKLALEGEPEGTVICAEGQTKGRGRLQREWISPKYKGIYLSLILRPEVLPNQSPILTLLVSVSICQAINKITSVLPSIKWPNDILVNDKKIGGILTELNAEQDKINFAIIGIGINVNTQKSILPPNASSLSYEAKKNFSRIDLVKEILRDIEYFYLLFKEEGALPIIKKWREFSSLTGERVKVICQKERLAGVVLDIDSDGGLVIREDSGFIKKVMAGDVVKVR
jgi:BirA family biotin operon repressor/biotin-[acetyl-CoA-carboxylase] ligase